MHGDTARAIVRAVLPPAYVVAKRNPDAAAPAGAIVVMDWKSTVERIQLHVLFQMFVLTLVSVHLSPF